MNKHILSHLARSLMMLLMMLSLASADDSPRLQQIKHMLLSPGSEQISLQLNGSYSPKVFTLKGESPRVVFDFADMSQGRGVSNLLKVNGPLVKTIRVGVHGGASPKTRVVFDMQTLKGVKFTQQFNAENSVLTIHFTGPEAAAAKTKKEPPPPPKEEKIQKKEAAAPKPTAEETAQTAQVTKTAEDKTAKSVEPKEAPQETPPQAVEQKAGTSPEKAVQEQTSQQQPQSAKPAPEPKEVVKAAKDDQKPEQPQEAKAEQATKTAESKETPVEAATEPSPEPEILAEPASKAPELASVKFDASSPKGEMVMFKLNGFFPPSVHGVEEGIPRVICDFNNTKLTGATKKRIKTNGKFVKTLRISKTKKPEKVRVVIDLEPNHSYDLQQVFFKDDNLFVIIVNTIKK